MKPTARSSRGQPHRGGSRYDEDGYQSGYAQHAESTPGRPFEVPARRCAEATSSGNIAEHSEAERCSRQKLGCVSPEQRRHIRICGPPHDHEVVVRTAKGTLAQPTDLSFQAAEPGLRRRITTLVSMRAWLRAGWLVLLADVAYWIWQMGHVNAESGLPRWHVAFNLATVVGGAILFVALLLGSYVVWRLNQNER